MTITYNKGTRLFKSYSETSDPISIPPLPNGHAVTISLYPKTGTWKRQMTDFPAYMVEASHADVVWTDIGGELTSASDNTDKITTIISSITFVRFVCVSEGETDSAYGGVSL